MPVNKRRSFYNSVNEESFIQARNDDEAEQATHRKENDLDTQLSTLSISSKNSTPNDETNSSANDKLNSTPNGTSIQDHFQMCLKMYTSNKINTQNAWQLDVFTYMQNLLASGEQTSSILQVAGSSIEVGAKIYCARIDDTHNEVLKLANSLNKVHIREDDELISANNSADSDNDDNDSETKHKQKTSRKKKHNKKAFNGENRATVYQNDAPVNTTINRLYNKCPEYDNSNLLNKGRYLKPGTFELLTTTEAKNLKWSSLSLDTRPAKPTMIPNTLFTELPSIYKICPKLSNFYCDLWNVDDDTDLNSTRGNDTQIQSDVVEDDYCYEPNATVTSEVETAANTGNQNGLVFITDMRPGNDFDETALTSEYTFRPLPNISENFKVTGAWVGPERWKLKSVRVNTISKKPDEDPVVKKQTKRTSNKCKPLEFVQTNIDEIKDILGGANKRTVKKLKTTADSCTCSEYMQIPEERRVTLMTRPKMKIYRSKRALLKPTAEDNLNITNYDYDNINDSEYCPAEGAEELNNWEEDANTPLEADEQKFNQKEQNHNTFANIMEKSISTDNSSLTYALKAKVMDMKKLKNAIWREISHDQQKVEENKEDKPVVFSHMYEQIPNKLSSVMKENLSAPLAFVALLHLANEHNLIIQNDDNFDDLTICRKDMKKPTDSN